MDPERLVQIEQLYLKMYESLFEYANGSFFSETLAEEAVQETFCIACQKYESLCSSPNPEGWLFVALKYVLANMVRNCAVADRVLSDYMAYLAREKAVSVDNLDIGILYNDIGNTEEFKLLKEVAVEGKSHYDIATERGITISASKKRVQRAKEILRKKIKK